MHTPSSNYQTPEQQLSPKKRLESLQAQVDPKLAKHLNELYKLYSDKKLLSQYSASTYQDFGQKVTSQFQFEAPFQDFEYWIKRIDLLIKEGKNGSKFTDIHLNCRTSPGLKDVAPHAFFGGSIDGHYLGQKNQVFQFSELHELATIIEMALYGAASQKQSNDNKKIDSNTNEVSQNVKRLGF